ncbi:MAG: AraC family transcriptional regulator [Erysipelotrichaceae bacterium]|nr:AraC family transcriptional regulator [Erysipelotrichaceae bacterium]
MGNKQYDIASSNFTNINAKLIYVTSAKYETDWHSIMHSHPFTELFYVLSGKGKFYIEDDTFDVKEDDLVIVNANVRHTESSKDDEPLEYIVIGIEGISLLTQEIDQPEYCSIHNYRDYKHEVLFYLKTLLLEVAAKSEYYDLIAQNLLEVLLANIIRRTNTKLTIGDVCEANESCTYIKNYIESNYNENLTLDDLCKISYMNKYYLVHSFKKQFHITPIAYLNEVRLKEASKLLKNTNLSVSQIANIIGMSSQSYFAQSFKKVYRVSPNEYRKLNH